MDRGSSCPVRLGTLFRTTWDILFHVSKVLSGRTEVSVAAAVFTLATGILLLTSNLLGLWLAECTHPAASFLGILGLCEAVISRLGKSVCLEISCVNFACVLTGTRAEAWRPLELGL